MRSFLHRLGSSLKCFLRAGHSEAESKMVKTLDAAPQRRDEPEKPARLTTWGWPLKLKEAAKAERKSVALGLSLGVSPAKPQSWGVTEAPCILFSPSLNWS